MRIYQINLSHDHVNLMCDPLSFKETYDDRLSVGFIMNFHIICGLPDFYFLSHIKYRL